MVFVDNIQNYCRSKQITIAQFERQCNLSNGIVDKWKKGKNNSPSLQTLMRIQAGTGFAYSRWLKEGGIPDKKAASR